MVLDHRGTRPRDPEFPPGTVFESRPEVTVEWERLVPQG